MINQNGMTVDDVPVTYNITTSETRANYKVNGSQVYVKRINLGNVPAPSEGQKDLATEIDATKIVDFKVFGKNANVLLDLKSFIANNGSFGVRAFPVGANLRIQAFTDLTVYKIEYEVYYTK